mmetsp:Transcript_144074/g.461227  ORF Transcript_144074/g.461227 Transcript_144074/m.461227 type:complete len:311 (-) Transcript_144074:965-1897(-)
MSLMCNTSKSERRSSNGKKKRGFVRLSKCVESKPLPSSSAGACASSHPWSITAIRTLDGPPSCAWIDQTRGKNQWIPLMRWPMRSACGNRTSVCCSSQSSGRAIGVMWYSRALQQALKLSRLGIAIIPANRERSSMSIPLQDNATPPSSSSGQAAAPTPFQAPGVVPCASPIANRHQRIAVSGSHATAAAPGVASKLLLVNMSCAEAKACHNPAGLNGKNHSSSQSAHIVVSSAAKKKRDKVLWSSPIKASLAAQTSSTPTRRATQPCKPATLQAVLIASEICTGGWVSHSYDLPARPKLKSPSPPSEST